MSANAGETSFKPSTADRTEIAGVITGIAVEERGTRDAEPQEHGRTPLCHGLTERHEREGAAFAVVVGAQ